MQTHIRIVLLALVIWGRGIRLQQQLLDGALEEGESLPQYCVITSHYILLKLRSDFSHTNSISLHSLSLPHASPSNLVYTALNVSVSLWRTGASLPACQRQPTSKLQSIIFILTMVNLPSDLLPGTCNFGQHLYQQLKQILSAVLQEMPSVI